jgi:hypothetical protein
MTKDNHIIPTKNWQAMLDLSRLLKAIVLLLTLNACATSPKPNQLASSQYELPRLETATWYMADKRPTTFYPVGFPAGSPTSSSNGTWINAENGRARWFIPRNGVDGRTQSQLREEAFTQRLERQIAGADRGAMGLVREVGMKSAITGAYTGLTVFAAMGQAELPWEWVGNMWEGTFDGGQ